jgi:hypothetical protein
MKIQIRKGCFETNSSSTHAICISRDNVNIDDLPKHITFTHGEFGWEAEVYDGTWEKASYLYQAICDCCYDNENELREKLEQLERLLATYGIECDFEPERKNVWGSGYIDHGYETIDFVDAVLKDPDKLMRYLFNDSIIITGNDNDDWFEEYMYNEPYQYPQTYKDEFKKYEIFKKGN